MCSTVGEVNTMKLLVEENRFSQNCYIPMNILRTSGIKIGDLVDISCGTTNFICRIFPWFRPENNCIFVDDLVSYDSNNNCGSKDEEIITFPRDFSVLKAVSFKSLKIKLILHASKKPLVVSCANYKRIVCLLVQNFIFKSASTIKLSGNKLADLYEINSIIVENTYPVNVCGRMTKNSDIQLTEILCISQQDHMKQFIDKDISAFKDAKILCESYLSSHSISHRRIILTGPPGCGKTVFVNKLCSELNCHFASIDGLKSSELTFSESNAHYEYLKGLHKSFPSQLIVFFIDHLDMLSPCDKKFKDVSVIVDLIEKLSKINVFVIAAAPQKNLIHPVVVQYFAKEVFLGVLTLEQRKTLLKSLVKVPVADDCDFDKIAQRIPGFITCDIVLLAQEAVKISKEKSLMSESPFVSMENFKEAVACITPSLLKMSKWNLNVKPIYWKEIGGMENIKKRLQMGIEWPLHHPDIFQKVSLPCPHGVLLFGPPGCCKTTLARGLATECKANFFAASPAQIYSPYVGESEKNICDLFYQARLCAPSIIFLDELDSLVGKRNFESKSQGIAEKVLSTLLNEMDGFSQKTNFGENLCLEQYQKDFSKGKEVIVIGATNRPDLIDNALLRPGRFDIILYVSPPDIQERKSILLTVTEGMPLFNIDFQKIADITNLFSGADLKNLCNMAAIEALRKDLNAEFIVEEDFYRALNKIKPSITKSQIDMYEKLSSKYGPVITK